MLVDWAGITASVFDPVTGRRSPAYLFVASFLWSSWVYAECFPDMRTRSRAAAHVHALQAAGGVPDIIVPDNCATATDRGRKPGPVKVNDAYLEMAEHYGCAVVPARAEAEGQGVRGEGGRPVRDVGARPARRRALHEPRRAQRRGAEARRRAERQALLPARGLPRRRVLRRGAGRPEPAAGGALRVVRAALLMSIYLSPLSPTQIRRSRQRTFTDRANVRRRFRRPCPEPGPWCGRTSR